MDAHRPERDPDLDGVLQADRWARTAVLSRLSP